MNKLFQVHKLNASGLDAAKCIAQQFNNVAEYIENLPDGREKSIALTKLEEACFFAKKAIAVLPENQEKPNDQN